ncbi:hypothetical protein M758_12G070500 [Ceratodon purpureus]|nr:hypothetical protein M758_12G070500 [Ceratodon purpureus]
MRSSHRTSLLATQCPSLQVDSAPEKKMSKLVMDILKSAPVIHVYCNTQLTCLEFLKAQLPPWSLAAPFLREARKDAGAVNRAYLLSLDEALSRSVQNIRSTVVNWLVSFESTVSPTVQRLAIHALLRMRLKQLAQGVFLASNLQHIIRATIDCHVSLDVVEVDMEGDMVVAGMELMDMEGDEEEEGEEKTILWDDL